MEATPVTRVGIMIRKYGSWRDTVERYASYKNLEDECLLAYDFFLSKGMEESWAALRALDQFACADILMNQIHHSHDHTIN